MNRPNTFNDPNKANNKAYVAGLGRGAAGFITAAQTAGVFASQPTGPPLVGGTNRNVVSFGAAPAGYTAGVGRGSGGFGETKPGALKAEGTGGGLFDPITGFSGNASTAAAATYGSEDQYADSVFAQVDEQLKKRRKKTTTTTRDGSAPTNGEGSKQKTITDEFSDLKRNLERVSKEEWNSLPEVQAHVKANPALRPERLSYVTDSVITGKMHNASVLGTELSTARDQMLRVNLDRYADAEAMGEEESNTNELLKSLTGNSSSTSSSASTTTATTAAPTATNGTTLTEFGDVAKARALLRSVTHTNPKSGAGWIAAARLEETAGKITAARDLMRRACEACPEQEDVWLECARLNAGENAKVILATAVTRYHPNNPILWLAAADLEIGEAELAKAGRLRLGRIGEWGAIRKVVDGSSTSEEGAIAPPLPDLTLEARLARRRKILTKALDRVPRSFELWRAALAIETEENSPTFRALLERAATMIPDRFETQVALLRVASERERFAAVQKRFPDEPRAWIYEANLVEEQNGEKNVIETILRSMPPPTTSTTTSWSPPDSILIDRMLDLAQDCEQRGYLVTAAALVKEIARRASRSPLEAKLRGLEENPDAARCAETIHELGVTAEPRETGRWVEYTRFARRRRGPEGACRVLARAVVAAPESQLLWLVYAKELWKGVGRPREARAVLKEAFTHCPREEGREELWLAAAKLAKLDSLGEARDILSEAREECLDSVRVWIKSALLEREASPWGEAGVQAERTLVDAALTRFPKDEKLWLMAAQHQAAVRRDTKGAAGILRTALEALGTAAPPRRAEAIFMLLAKYEEETEGGAPRARAVLDMARLKQQNYLQQHRTPVVPSLNAIREGAALWLYSVRFETRQGQAHAARALVSRALEIFPKCGELMAESVLALTERLKQKKLLEEYFKRVEGKSAAVFLAGAQVWYALDKDLAKAERWVDKAIAMEPRLGDAYAWKCKLLGERQGPDVAAKLEAVEATCEEVNPNAGERWIAVKKARGHEGWTPRDILKRVVELL